MDARRALIATGFVLATLVVPVLLGLPRGGIPDAQPTGFVWGEADICGPLAAGTQTITPDVQIARAGAESGGVFGFLTNDGSYMPRTHCMVTAEGGTDWPWVIGLIVLNLLVIGGYARIFWFWRRTYLDEDPRDRNTKLMDLAWMFMWCAVCGSVSSIVVFVWPAYRLLAICLIPLAFFTWRFAANLDDFRLSLSAKRLQRELAETLQAKNKALQEAVDRATHEAHEARLEAERANDAKSEFLASMSHEIRTPMTAIMGYTQMMCDPGVPESQRREFGAVVERNGQHLLGLINDILDLSKIEAEQLELETAPCNIAEIVCDVTSVLDAQARGKGVDLRVRVGAAVPARITSDALRVRQILMNLVGNATKFTTRGHVTIRVERDAGDMVFAVEDTGVGMTPEQAERVLEAFEQADASTTRQFGGTGLGLAISRELAAKLGGTIEVESELGSGSVFTLRLPAANAEGLLSPADLGASVGDRSVGSGQTLPAGTRILLAEDGEDNRRLIVRLLSRAGADVECVEDGRAAIHAAMEAVEENRPFHLILMDMQMPVLDGVEAVRQLRHLGYTDPIMALTANAMERDRRRCMEAGCDGFLSKPIEREVFFDTVRRWSEKASSRRGAA